ncbi:FRIGIDA-like protein 4a isoform X2 [Panicum miliaceum]|uniref:FRIGIDA-like protein n=1 Tax=Panicum miliaceum TaxID=4540 RepID=A0A3L6S5V2_PANMI|nr:FRIGIDA-like protein 4a isoform X2 [Panicum miliaceum]
MADAAQSIPDAMASLQTYSTALSAFTAAWRSVESQAAGLDSTLAARLAGFSELELICSAMDGTFTLFLIEKMKQKKSKQLEAVKFIQALIVVHKYPLMPVLRSYISAATLAGKMIRIRGDDPASQNAADAKERTLLGTLQKVIKEHKLEELPILEEANKRTAQLEQQSAERERAAAAAVAAAQQVSKNIEEQQKIQQLMQPAKRSKVDNVVLGSSGQNVHSAGTPSQQFIPRQSIHTAVAPNQYQAALNTNALPAITQISQVVTGNHRPIGIQSQVPVAPAVPTQYGGPDYEVTSSRPYRSSTLAPGPSALNVPSGRASTRSKLYSGDPLAAVSRSSGKKGSSYNYSLSNMSTYDPK